MADPPPVLHPNMASTLPREGRGLSEALSRRRSGDEAAEIIRSLVERIVVVPTESGFELDLHGDLAGIFALASERKQPPGREARGLQVSLVAGAGFEPAAFRL